MSEENVEIVRRIYAEWETGNFLAALPVLDQHVTVETFMPDSNQMVVVQGLEELASFMRDWFSQWRNYHVTSDEIRAVGTDHVFVAGCQAATGRQSGVEVGSPGFTVWTFARARL